MLGVRTQAKSVGRVNAPLLWALCMNSIMSKYQDQLKRVERYYKKIEDLPCGVGETEKSWLYCDDIYTFFMHCYHLKDYLKNDPEYTKHTNSEIESYISSTRSLSLCADICNGLKHLKLTNPRSGNVLELGAHTMSMNLLGYIFGDDNELKTTVSASFKHGNNELDAFTIAKESIEAWHAFI